MLCDEKRDFQVNVSSKHISKQEGIQQQPRAGAQEQRIEEGLSFKKPS